MEVDHTTYEDLSVFHSEEEFSIFHKLDLTRTGEGRDWLYRIFRKPHNDIIRIRETQQIVKMIGARWDDWPASISNGTLMVVERFYTSTIDTIPATANYLNALSYKLFHTADFSLVRYSIKHFGDFLSGMRQLTELLQNEDTPRSLALLLARIAHLLRDPEAWELSVRPAGQPYSVVEIIRFGRFLRNRYRNHAHELIQLFGQLDAWYAMAAAVKRYRLCFPEFREATEPFISMDGLYHMLLAEPVPYDVKMNKESNFIFLTGANMAGKSTFIKAIGSAVFLAHLGMGVPAASMTLTVFDGLLSNINVVDNVVKGESYFFNEVQRIKNTVHKITDGRKWLVLIDELFKGTNVQDAMRCSAAVIRGLIRIRSSIFVLSTHLYEIAAELKEYSNISFKYFETSVQEDQLAFSYQLREGISNDRIGYLILKREKVIELLEKL